ncbi:MAG: rhodanese-like domain-containing protein [Flavobacteriales bacterium]
MSIFSFLFKKNKAYDSITLLSPKEFKQKISNKKVQLIDVRRPSEFQQGTIKNAKNIDFFSGKFISEFEKLNKDQAVFLFCRSGSRSRQTARKLANMGFQEIYDLQGGILNWK